MRFYRPTTTLARAVTFDDITMHVQLTAGPSLARVCDALPTDCKPVARVVRQ